MNRRADRGRMGKSQKSAKPYGRATPNWNPQSGIHFSPSLSQAKDHPSINVRKILDTTSPIYVAVDVGYLDKAMIDRFMQQAEEVACIVGGLRTSVQRQKEDGCR